MSPNSTSSLSNYSRPGSLLGGKRILKTEINILNNYVYKTATQLLKQQILKALYPLISTMLKKHTPIFADFKNFPPPPPL